MNDVIWKAIKRAQIPGLKEPVSLTMKYNKLIPDSTTLFP